MPTSYVNPNKDYFEQQKANLPATDVNAITSSSLAQTPSLAYKQPEQVPVYPVAKMEIPELQMTAPEKQADQFTTTLQGLNDQLVGESSFRAQEEQKAQINQKTQTLNDLSTRLTSLKNEAQAIPMQLQQDATGRGITAGGLRPIETAALRNNAIQALSTNSLLQAAQGNLTTALDMVDRAVAQKYDPIREEIAAKTANLNLILNSPSYSLAEKNRAQKQQQLLDQQKAAVDIQQADALAKGKSVVAAAQRGAPATVLKRMQEAATDADALLIAASEGFASDPVEPTKLQFQTLTFEDEYGNKSQRIVAFDPYTGKPVNSSAGGITSVGYSGDSSGGGGPTSSGAHIKLSSEDTKTLVGAGFSDADIRNLRADLAAHGTEAVLAGIDSPTQKAAVQNVLNIKPKVTKAAVAAKVTAKAAQEGLAKNFTEKELNDLAKENGFASIWKSRAGEREAFLASEKAKQVYIDFLYNQYKEAGMAE